MTKSVTNGIMAGLIAVAMFVIAYAIDRNMIYNPVLYWISMIPFIAMMWMSIRSSAKNGGEHQSLLRSAFVCFLVANVIYYIYYFVMMKYVANDLHVAKIQELNEAMKTMDGMPGVAKQKLNAQITFWGVLLSYFQGAIGGFILSLLLVFVNKKK